MESTPEKNPVVMVSSDSSAKMITVPSRNSCRQTLLKPQAVDIYNNNNMNGVDVAVQLTVFYPFIRKTRKWWRKLFFWLVEVAVISERDTLRSVQSRIVYILYTRKMVPIMGRASS